MARLLPAAFACAPCACNGNQLSAPAFVTGVDFSDHRSFWEHGYPAVMVTDTAFCRNPRYHTADDRPETLDFARMAEVVKGLHCAVQSVARR